MKNKIENLNLKKIEVVKMEGILELYNKKKESDDIMIQKAVNYNIEMLNVNDFIKITGFELNEILPVDMMWNTFQKGIPIYISNDLIKVFGYKGELAKQKENLLKLVKKYNIPVTKLTNKSYEAFSSPPAGIGTDVSAFYPKVDKSQGKNKTLHYLIMPRHFKELLVVVDTENGRLAREYVLKLEDLIHLYLEYQIYYEKNRNFIAEKHYNKSLAEMQEMKQFLVQKIDDQTQKIDDQTQQIGKQSQKIDDQSQKIDDQTEKIDDLKETNEVQQEVLDEMNSKLDRSTDERAPRTKNSSKHEEFVIARVSNFPEIKYYSMRCQKTVVKRTLKKLKTRYPEMTIITEISYQPNSKNLFNLMKENLASKITVKGNVVQLNQNYTEEEFIKDIKDLDNLKKEMDTDEE